MWDRLTPSSGNWSVNEEQIRVTATPPLTGRLWKADYAKNPHQD